jgi:hypothetical protein
MSLGSSGLVASLLALGFVSVLGPADDCGAVGAGPGCSEFRTRDSDDINSPGPERMSRAAGFSQLAAFNILLF